LLNPWDARSVIGPMARSLRPGDDMLSRQRANVPLLLSCLRANAVDHRPGVPRMSSPSGGCLQMFVKRYNAAGNTR